MDVLTWDKITTVADMIHVNDLDKDQLHSEFCDIKPLYDYVKRKNVKLVDQVRSHILTKTNDIPAFNINHPRIELDYNEQVSSMSNEAEELIRSHQLCAYLLNIRPDTTPNFKK